MNWLTSSKNVFKAMQRKALSYKNYFDGNDNLTALAKEFLGFLHPKSVGWTKKCDNFGRSTEKPQADDLLNVMGQISENDSISPILVVLYFQPETPWDLKTPEVILEEWFHCFDSTRLLVSCEWWAVASPKQLC